VLCCMIPVACCTFYSQEEERKVGELQRQHTAVLNNLRHSLTAQSNDAQALEHGDGGATAALRLAYAALQFE
jgi:hypothetical protein